VLLVNTREVPSATAAYLTGLNYRSDVMGFADALGPAAVMPAVIRRSVSRLLQ
jgi:hypothetical protein